MPLLLALEAGQVVGIARLVDLVRNGSGALGAGALSIRYGPAARPAGFKRHQAGHLGRRVHRNGRSGVHGLHLGRHPIADRPAGWMLSGVDMSAARPRDFQLIGVDLGSGGVDIRLPDDADHWLIADWPAFLDRVERLIGNLVFGDERLTAKIWLDYARRGSGTHQRIGFVAVWDLHQLGGSALTELLHQAR
jgi:hypothetical protein